MAARVDPGVAKRWGLPTEATAWPTVLLSLTAWAVLGTVTVAISGVGMWLFARNEYRDDI